MIIRGKENQELKAQERITFIFIKKQVTFTEYFLGVMYAIKCFISMYYLIQQTFKLSTIIIPILQKKKLNHTKIK